MTLAVHHWAGSSDACAIERSRKALLKCGDLYFTPFVLHSVWENGFILAGVEFEYKEQRELKEDAVHAYASNKVGFGQESYSLGVIAWGRFDIASMALYVPIADTSGERNSRVREFERIIRSPVRNRMWRLLDSCALPALVRHAVSKHLDYEW